MSTASTAPLQLGFPAEAVLALSPQERMTCRANQMEPGRAERCEIPLHIGVFFDGTNNNRKRDEPQRSHTNIVRLFNAHPSVDHGVRQLRMQGHYSIYIPGVGTPFEANGEYHESREGKAFGKGSQARILYGVIEVFNAISKAFRSDKPLLSESDVAAKLQAFAAQVEGGDSDHERPRPSRDQWVRDFAQAVGRDIATARKAIGIPRIPTIYISVYGFSRGAAKASAFCHWLNAAIPNGEIAGMRVRLGFLGLFDCVASVGLADSGRRVMGLPFADGHFDWAGVLRKPLPAMVERCVHMVAAHEQRMNFPLTRIRGGKVTEYVYPGVHADVGGGYGTGEQGRSPQEGELLSQLPLMQMHKLARQAGAPLVDYAYMEDYLLEDYALAKPLVQHYNAYMRTATADFAQRQAPGAQQTLAECTDLHALIAQHMRLFYDYRRANLGPKPGTQPSVWHAPNHDPSAQDIEDINSANALLMGDIALAQSGQPAADLPCNYVLRKMLTQPLPVYGAYTAQGKPQPAAPAVQLQATDIAWLQWVKPLLQGRGVVQDIHAWHHVFLRGYVHDSLAGFYLRGYASGHDMAEKLLQLVQSKAQGMPARNPHEDTVLANYERESATNMALKQVIQTRIDRREKIEKSHYDYPSDKWKAQEAYERTSDFTPEESAIVARSGVFPVVSDADANQLDDSLVLRQLTAGRREGGGYLLPRAIFE